MLQWEGTLYQFLCPCFGLAQVLYVFTKLDPFKKDRDTHSDLFGRHADYWQNKGRDYSSAKYGHPFTSVLGFVINQKKSVMTPVHEIEFLRVIVNSNEVTISLPHKKITINKRDVSGSVSESRDSSFRVTKNVMSLGINNFGNFSSKAPFSFSPTATNSASEEKCLLRKSSVTEQKISIGASLAGEKH